MPQHVITALDDPHLEPFIELRSRNWTEQSGVFIAEGPLLVESLLRSTYDVKSILLDRKYESHYASMIPEQVDVLLVEHDFVEQIVGFNFHRGVIGCGLRKPRLTLREHFLAPASPAETLVAAVGVQDPENLGGILRSCAALGVERVLIGPGTADPLSRRVLRVSMGNALRLQLFHAPNLASDLAWLEQQYAIESVATSLQPGSQSLETATRQSPVLLLVGNERHGLPPALQAAASRRIRIDMVEGCDSLNVGVAAGIILHYFCRLAPSEPKS